MRAVPLSDALGAELVDFDVTRAPTAEEQAEVRRLFRRHHLLLVRPPAGTTMTAEMHDRFVGCLGPLQSNRIGDAAGYVTNQDDPRSLFGDELWRLLWHNDGAYGPKPGIATSLWAEVISPDATPTQFANAVEVVDRLPADLLEQVQRLRIVNAVDTASLRTYERVPYDEILTSDEPGRFVTYEHPVLFDPPHLDRKAIIASEQMTVHVVGLDEADGDAFLEALYHHLYADDNVYTHHWQPNDMIVWDNIALHHSRPAAPGPEPRHLRRQCIDGWYRDDGTVLEWALSRAMRSAASG
jgi:taurine dioxygenase